MDNSIFLNIINQIVSNHSCIIKDIDLSNNIIDISCPTKEKEIECAIELEELLSNYAC